MKFFSLIFICVSITINLLAQAPQKMSYQAVIRNSNNNLVVNATIGTKISILQNSPNGTQVYSERHVLTTNDNGLLSLEIGTGTIISGSFSAIPWANGPFFIKTETDLNGGTNYTITGTSQLLSVPYALYAESSGTPGPQGPQGIQGPPGSGGFTHYIGEKFDGGVVFHVYRDSLGYEHGLIVTINDQASAYQWSNVGNTAIGSSARSSWNGLGNSTAIVNQTGHTNSSAQLCLNLVSNGFNDWYLPSLEEARLLVTNCFNVNKTLSTIIGSTQIEGYINEQWIMYHTSTELGSGVYHIFTTALGVAAGGKEGVGGRVRAIRAF